MIVHDCSFNWLTEFKLLLPFLLLAVSLNLQPLVESPAVILLLWTFWLRRNEQLGANWKELCLSCMQGGAKYYIIFFLQTAGVISSVFLISFIFHTLGEKWVWWTTLFSFQMLYIFNFTRDNIEKIYSTLASFPGSPLVLTFLFFVGGRGEPGNEANSTLHAGQRYISLFHVH